MIFLAALGLILFTLLGILRVLVRIRDDIRSICHWYCEDQK